jgi:hypothetical protein
MREQRWGAYAETLEREKQDLASHVDARSWSPVQGASVTPHCKTNRGTPLGGLPRE